MTSKLLLKVRNGTRGTELLCKKCRNSQIMQGSAESEEFVYCHALRERVPFQVVECSRFLDSSATPLSRLVEMAWVLKTDGPSRKIGFTPYKKMSDKDKDGFDDLLW